MKSQFKEPQAFEEGPAPLIEMTPVDSNQVKAVGYNPDTKTLAVTFTHGTAIYHYPGVTPEQHQAFIEAKSIGTHFGVHIKPLAFKKYAPEPAQEEAKETTTA